MPRKKKKKNPVREHKYPVRPLIEDADDKIKLAKSGFTRNYVIIEAGRIAQIMTGKQPKYIQVMRDRAKKEAEKKGQALRLKELFVVAGHEIAIKDDWVSYKEFRLLFWHIGVRLPKAWLRKTAER